MAMGSAIRSFTLDIEELGWTGQDLQRESVVAEADGTLWASDGRGGVTRIDPDGGQALLAGWGGEPNGLAIDPGGNLVTRQHRPRAGAADDPRRSRSPPCWRRSTASAPPTPTSCSTTAGAAVGDLPDPRGPLVAGGRRRPDGFIVLVDERGPGSWPTASTPPTRPGWTPRSATCTWPRP